MPSSTQHKRINRKITFFVAILTSLMSLPISAEAAYTSSAPILSVGQLNQIVLDGAPTTLSCSGTHTINNTSTHNGIYTGTIYDTKQPKYVVTFSIQTTGAAPNYNVIKNGSGACYKFPHPPHHHGG